MRQAKKVSGDQVNKMPVFICIPVFDDISVNETREIKHPGYPMIQYWKTEDGIRSYIGMDVTEFISFFSNIAK